MLFKEYGLTFVTYRHVMSPERIAVQTLALITILVTNTGCTGAGAEEVSGCYGNTMEISCPLGQRINILGDFYGLSKSQKCVYNEDDVCVVPTFGHTSMSKQVCNGRTSCVYTVSERQTCFKGEQKTNYQQIKYECIQESLIGNACLEGERFGNKGYLASPNYPMYYPKDMDCECELEAQDGGSLTLKTLEFRMHFSDPCRDYVNIRSGKGSRESLCGSVHRIFRGARVKMVFHSEKNSFKGFLFAYEGVSKGNVKASCRMMPVADDDGVNAMKRKHQNTTKPQVPKQQMKHRRPGYKHHFRRRTTTVLPATVTRNLEDLPISSPKAFAMPVVQVVSGCFGDIIHFQCGDGELIRIVDDVYGRGETGRCSYENNDCIVHAAGPTSIVSQLCSSKTRCRNLIVTRLFCKEHVSSYQQITYECVPTTTILNICSRLVTTASSGYLSSPNFPEAYPNNQSCSCTLSAHSGNVHLSIAHAALHDSSECSDWLEVKVQGTKDRQRMCGTRTQEFRGKTITIHFFSDYQYSHNGVWLFFQGTKDSLVDVACNVPFGAFRSSTLTPVSSKTTTLTSSTTELLKTEQVTKATPHVTTPPSRGLFLPLSTSVSSTSTYTLTSSTQVSMTSEEMETNSTEIETEATSPMTTAVQKDQTTSAENDSSDDEISFINDISNDSGGEYNRDSPIGISTDNEMAFSGKEDQRADNDFILIDDTKFDNNVIPKSELSNDIITETVDTQDGRQAVIKSTLGSTQSTERDIVTSAPARLANKGSSIRVSASRKMKMDSIIVLLWLLRISN